MRAPHCVVVGTGRAGGAFRLALSRAGWQVDAVAGRSPTFDALTGHDAPDGPDGLILLAVPDGAIADVARTVPPTDAVVAHVSGSLGLDSLAPHRRVGSIHPLMTLPDPVTGAARLADRCTFAIDGDPLLEDVVATLGGTAIRVPDERRPLYHAAATIASNHLTALCAQVERLAASVGVPVDAYWKLMAATLENVGAAGAGPALTGPAARGDWQTIEGHLAALPSDEDRELYLALSRRAAALAGRRWPDDLGG